MKRYSKLIYLLFTSLFIGCGVTDSVEMARFNEDWDEYCQVSRLAAQKGDPTGQTNFGWCHEEGVGGYKKSARNAAQWYTLAAKQGDQDASERLKEITGKSVKANLFPDENKSPPMRGSTCYEVPRGVARIIKCLPADALDQTLRNTK